MTSDYSVVMTDKQGRTTTLFINGDSIDEMVANGMPEGEAREVVESNAFENAISRGLIGDDAWIA